MRSPRINKPDLMTDVLIKPRGEHRHTEKIGSRNQLHKPRSCKVVRNHQTKSPLTKVRKSVVQLIAQFQLFRTQNC